MSGLSVNGRSPADEHWEIELERKSDIARLLARIEARLAALEPPAQSVEVIRKFLEDPRRGQAPALPLEDGGSRLFQLSSYTPIERKEISWL